MLKYSVPFAAWIWWSLISGLLLIVAAAVATHQPSPLQTFAASFGALGSSLAFAGLLVLRGTSATRRDYIRRLALIGALAGIAAYQTGAWWLSVRQPDAFPPPLWLFAVIAIATALLAVEALLEEPWAFESRISLALPAALLGFAILLAAPSSRWPALHSDPPVLIIAWIGLAGAFWAVGLARLRHRDSLLDTLATRAMLALGVATISLGHLAGQQFPMMVGDVLIGIWGLLTILAQLWPGAFAPPALAARESTVGKARSAPSGPYESILPVALVAVAVASAFAYPAGNEIKRDALLLTAALAVVTLIAMQVAMHRARESEIHQLERQNVSLAELANVDELTGLPNRRALEARLREEMDRAQRYQQPLSLCFVDIDHFKATNDRFGHAAGDAVLRGFAVSLRSIARSIDFVGRYGGEEFFVIAPGTWSVDGSVLGERIRTAAAELRFSGSNGTSIEVTVSVGVAGFPEHAIDLETLVDRTDQSLYESKREGRNRVTVFRPPISEA